MYIVGYLMAFLASNHRMPLAPSPSRDHQKHPCNTPLLLVGVSIGTAIMEKGVALKIELPCDLTILLWVYI